MEKLTTWVKQGTWNPSNLLKQDDLELQASLSDILSSISKRITF